MIFTLILTALTVGGIVKEQLYYSANTEDLLKLHTTPTMLIKDELDKIPHSQWQQKITELQPLFGYPINLGNINNSDLSLSEINILTKQSSYGHADSSTLYYMLSSPQYYISLGPIYAGTEHYLDDSQREAVGAFNLLEQQLMAIPKAHWGNKIELLNKHTFFPLVLIELEAINLEPKQLRKLQSGQVIFHIENEKFYIYKRLANTNLVIMADDTSQTEPWYYELISELMYPFLLLAAMITTLLWIKPFWRDLEKIHLAIDSFNNGKFSHQIKTRDSAQLKPIADSFNHLSIKLEQLIQGNKDLSNAVSHEFKTPLSNIAFSVELIREKKTHSEPYLLSIEEDVEQLNNLVDEFLSYAKFQYAQPKLNIKPIYLRELTDNLKIKSKSGIKLDVQPHNQRLVFNCDHFYMQRALDNVISNAYKYAKALVKISIEIDQESYSLTIEDDGCGINDFDKKRVLLPFERGDTLKNVHLKGTGFGLAIVNTIMNWHHGNLFIEDSDHGGAKITLKWPQVVTH